MNPKITPRFVVKTLIINSFLGFGTFYALKYVFEFEFSLLYILIVILIMTIIDTYFEKQESTQSFLKNGVCTITGKNEDCDEDCITCTISVNYK